MVDLLSMFTLQSGSYLPMQKILIVLVTTFFLSACFPGVYKIDIPQGNVVTQEMVDQLRPGMTYSQVRFIMGTPLITDTFAGERWDYLYSMQRGGGPREQERLSLFFENGQLVRMSGDFKPGNSD